MTGASFTDLLTQAFGPPATPRPVKPARPPAHCDRREFRRYALADHTYRREVAAYIAAVGFDR